MKTAPRLVRAVHRCERQNWLLDAEWNIILIDHSRALTNKRDLYHQLFFDPELWEKMKALDEASLTAAIGPWVEKGSIKAVLGAATRWSR